MLRAKAAANTSAIVRIQGLLFFSAGALSWQRSNNVGVPFLFLGGVQRIQKVER
jgi:hypothetical protein